VHPVLPRLLTKLSGQSALLRSLDQYYTGSQPLSYLSPELQRSVQGRLKSLTVNLPRLVVNSLEERLDIDGFRLAEDQPADDELWRIWQANDCDEQSQMLHLDALVHGRSFVTVWADPDDPKTPIIAGESAEQMVVSFIPGTQRVAAAAKVWAEDDMAYATLFLSDVIYQYEAEAPGSGVPSAPMQWELRDTPIPHDLGIVPVVPFFNRPRFSHLYGESEMTDVLPVADAINKLCTDMMTSSEFHAMPRRWITGIDTGSGEGSEDRARELLNQQFVYAPAGKPWVSDDPATRFGQFVEASLDNFIKAIEMLEAIIAGMAGLPPHMVGLFSQANPASADAIRSAEASLVKRAKRKQRVFGGGWEKVMRLAMLVRDGSVNPSARSMETIWRDPQTPTWAQQVDAAVKLDSIGLPFRQNMESLGYTPVQIERMIKSRTDDSYNDVKAQLGNAVQIVEVDGFSRAAALAAVGLEAAAKVEAIVEARAPGPGVINDAELAAEVAAATPVVPADGGPAVPSKAADKAPPAPVA
jgi:hypothetical protein